MYHFQIVNDKVFPQIQNGFLDQEPAIREKTVIAVIHLAPKLNFANLDECVVSISMSLTFICDKIVNSFGGIGSTCIN